MKKSFWLIRAIFWIFVKTRFIFNFEVALQLAKFLYDNSDNGEWSPKEAVETEMSCWREDQ